MRHGKTRTRKLSESQNFPQSPDLHPHLHKIYQQVHTIVESQNAFTMKVLYRSKHVPQ